MILFPVKYTGPRMLYIRGPVYFESPFFSGRCFRMRPESSRGRQPAWNGITSPSPLQSKGCGEQIEDFSRSQSGPSADRSVHPHRLH